MVRADFVVLSEAKDPACEGDTAFGARMLRLRLSMTSQWCPPDIQGAPSAGQVEIVVAWERCRAYSDDPVCKWLESGLARSETEWLQDASDRLL
jgi:hypothetical protein